MWGIFNFMQAFIEMSTDNTMVSFVIIDMLLGIIMLMCGFYWIEMEHEDKKMELIEMAQDGWVRALDRLKEEFKKNMNLKLELRKAYEENEVLRAKKSKK